MTSKCSLNFDCSFFCFWSIQINIDFLFLQNIEIKSTTWKKAVLVCNGRRRPNFTNIKISFSNYIIDQIWSVREVFTWPGNSFASIGLGKCWSLGASSASSVILMINYFQETTKNNYSQQKHTVCYIQSERKKIGNVVDENFFVS